VVEPSHDCYNPLDYIRPDHLVRDAEVVADGLIRPERDGDGHFAEMAKDLLKAAIEVVLTVGKPAERTLVTVADLLLSTTILETLQSWADTPSLGGGRPARTAAAMLGAGGPERGAVFTTLKKNLAFLEDDAMRHFLSRSTVSLEDLLDDRLDLFVVVPLDLIKQQANFLRLFVNLVLGTVTRQDGYRVASKRILLMLDEFTRLGRLEQLLSIATVGAGSGIEAVFIAQDKGSVDQVWGRESAGTLLGSCATVRIFGLGRTDSVTAKWAEEQLGSQTVLTEARRTGPGEPSLTRSETRQKLMTSDQIQELPPDQMLCFIRSQRPLMLERIISHKHPEYRQKLDPNPVVRA
jgi:type IV secretion system protein VirD4